MIVCYNNGARIRAIVLTIIMDSTMRHQVFGGIDSPLGVCDSCVLRTIVNSVTFIGCINGLRIEV